MLISTTICHQGLVRDQNEDSYISNLDEKIWLVADGVGGNAGGHIASQLAVQTVERKLRQENSLSSAIYAANEAILSASLQQSELEGMATTLVAVRFVENQFELAWVGDSRAYIIDSNSIDLLSSDHNVANELYLKGELAEEDVQSHIGQHELTQALGQLSLVEIPQREGVLFEGSTLLLCTDGLSGVLNDDLLLKVVSSGSSLEKISQTLLDLVLELGAPDNVTFTFVRYIQETHKLSVSNYGKSSCKPTKTINKAPITWGVLSIVGLVIVLLFYLG